MVSFTQYPIGLTDNIDQLLWITPHNDSSLSNPSMEKQSLLIIQIVVDITLAGDSAYVKVNIYNRMVFRVSTRNKSTILLVFLLGSEVTADDT
jgi:hypothetical protein